MRAKLKVSAVSPYKEGEVVTHEHITMDAVCASDYGPGGSDENNTYALYTPSACLQIVITNPNLIGKHVVGQEFYLDFTKAN